MTNTFTVLQTNTMVQGEKSILSCSEKAFLLLHVYYSDERFNAGDEGVESAFKLLPNTATHVATSNFQAEFCSKLLLTDTYLRKRAVATLSYSPASTLHPKVI